MNKNTSLAIKRALSKVDKARDLLNDASKELIYALGAPELKARPLTLKDVYVSYGHWVTADRDSSCESERRLTNEEMDRLGLRYHRMSKKV